MIGWGGTERDPSAPASLPHVRDSRVPGIRPRGMAALIRAMLHRLTASPAAAVEDDNQVTSTAAGRQ